MEVKSTFVLPNELKLNLNTEGHCLICLNPSKSKRVKNEGNNEARNSSLLWELFNYLKINTEEIVSQFERTFVFSKTGKVSFCTRCIGLMEKFTNLLKKLEEIQSEINQSLGKIKTEVCESFKNKEVNEAYSMRVTSNDESLDMFVLVDNLRKLISTKCPSVKLENAERTPKTEDFAKFLPKTLQVPTTPTKFHCDLCPQKFKLSFLLARHKETFHCVKKFTCKFCSKVWTDRGEYELHEKQCLKSPLEEGQEEMETETNEADADWIPSDHEDKPKKKKSRKVAKLGKYFSKDDATNKYKCNLCGKLYSSEFGAQAHYESVHLKKRYKCNNCSTTFTRPCSLQDHERNKTCQKPEGIVLKYEHECDICHKLFTSEAIMKQHKRKVHLRQQVSSCDLCDMKFTTRGSLTRHKMEVHFKNKKFTCKNCSKSWFSRWRYADHMKVCVKKKTKKKTRKTSVKAITKEMNKTLQVLKIIQNDDKLIETSESEPIVEAVLVETKPVIKTELLH